MRFIFQIVVIMLSVFMICSNSFALYLSKDDSVEQFSKYYEYLKMRTKTIPENDFQIQSEKNWAIEELSVFSRIEDKLKDEPEMTNEYNAILTHWQSISGSVKTMNCSSPESVLQTLNSLVQFIPRYQRFIIRYDFESTSNFHELILILRNREYQKYFSKSYEPKESDCGKILPLFKNVKITNNISKAIADMDSEMKKVKELSALKTAKIREIQKVIEEYLNGLINKQSKAQTKSTIEQNLWNMILTIGLLSILAIAIVRLFPLSVMVEWVASGQVIQFVTVMLLLSVILCLGLAGLINENTLGTLLGGIGGYVLSQGVGRSVSRQVEKATSLKSRKGSTDFDDQALANNNEVNVA
jgi:hypothetical protein